jgi:pimeloyl-ACP methyl ester carboxylesterase
MKNFEVSKSAPSGQKVSKKKKWPLITVIIIAVLGMIYFLGPKPSRPDFSDLHLPKYNSDLHALEDSLHRAESSLSVKFDNEARIVWETPYAKTPYSIVYLHGNGASQEEGDPIHEAVAHRYGCNLFLSRLADHGLKEDDPLIHIDPEDWMQSALDAIAMGKAIGDKVILMSCSTGSTLALYLTSKYPDLVEGQVMLSPNVDMFDPRSSILAAPWGLQIARQISGSKYYGWKASSLAQQYWYTHYRIEGLVALKSMINATMTESTFSKINDPILILYYYQDDQHQDSVVSVKRMQEMFSELGTTSQHKKEVALSDAGTHIIGSSLFNQHLESVWAPVVTFMEGEMFLVPVNDTDWKPFLDK